MSLVGTLGKIAMGALVAKGVGKVVSGKLGGGSAPSQGGGVTRINQGGSNSGGLGGGLGGLLGGSGAGQSQSGAQTGGAGNIGDLLGGLLGGAQGGSGGGLGGLLESLGGAAAGGQAGGAGGLGDLLNSVLKGEAPPTVQATNDQDAQAEVMLKAMLTAAKCDGQLDDNERGKIMDQLQDVSAEDMEFVKRELAAPVDLQGLVRSVPRGMEQQVYLMSLMAIDLDSKAEADYLEKLGDALGLSHDMSNQIHAKLGVPTLFT